MPIAAKLKKKDKSISVIAVSDKDGKFNNVLDTSKDIDDVVRISGGKYRRYKDRPKLDSLTDVKTHALNLRDAGRTVKGLSQALGVISKYKPDIIFIKGGYVSVPVGLAAGIKKIPYITHDSDSVPSLVTKIIGKKANKKLIGMPVSESGFIHVGIPVSDNFKHVSNDAQKQFKNDINIEPKQKTILITGGSQGAQRINHIVSAILPKLSQDDIFVIHQTGTKFDAMPTNNYMPVPYIKDMYKYSGAADVIVCRAGSSMAEFAQQDKPMIAIPAKQLAGSHQVLNAKIIKENNAAVILDEDELDKNPIKLYETIQSLLTDSNESKKLADSAKKIYPDDAADKIVDMLLNSSK